MEVGHSGPNNDIQFRLQKPLCQPKENLWADLGINF
jgi:hypothetical protein